MNECSGVCVSKRNWLLGCASVFCVSVTSAPCLCLSPTSPRQLSSVLNSLLQRPDLCQCAALSSLWIRLLRERQGAHIDLLAKRESSGVIPFSRLQLNWFKCEGKKENIMEWSSQQFLKFIWICKTLFGISWLGNMTSFWWHSWKQSGEIVAHLLLVTSSFFFFTVTRYNIFCTWVQTLTSFLSFQVELFHRSRTKLPLDPE